MEIGLCLPHFGRPLETGRLLQVAQRADARGLDALWAILETIDVLAREVRPALGG